MDLTDEQRDLLKSADNDGRVFARPSREVEELIREGVLEPSGYWSGCYLVKQNPDKKHKI